VFLARNPLFFCRNGQFVRNISEKVFYKSIDKTVRDCTFTPFIQKFDEDKRRHLNIFAAFLLKYFDYIKNDKIILKIIEFHSLNDLQMPQDLPTAPIEGVQDDKKNMEKKATIKKPLSFDELIALATEKYNELSAAKTAQDEQLKITECELKKSKTELLEKNVEISDLKNKLYSTQNQSDILKEKLEREQTELSKTKIEKTDLEKVNANLQSRLTNIASGYGAAGQQEMDSLKGKLTSRLKVSFDKYAEIKSKQPDLDYYEVLILILDEIQKTLKKNGIEV